MIFTSSHRLILLLRRQKAERHTRKRIVIHLRPAHIHLHKNNLAQVSAPSSPHPPPRPLLACMHRSRINVYSFSLQALAVMERLTGEYNHKSDPAASTSLVPPQLAHYHILKHADSLPTEQPPCHQGKYSTSFDSLMNLFIFLFSFYFSFPFLSLHSSPVHSVLAIIPKQPRMPSKSKVESTKGISKPHPGACWSFRSSGMLSCSFSFVLIPPTLLFFSLSPSLVLLTSTPQIRSFDKVALSVAANSITGKKDDPFDTMELLCCAGAAESRLTPAQNPAFKQNLLLLHTGKVQTRRRERRECKKQRKTKRSRRRRQNEKLNYDSRTSTIRRKMKVRLRDWRH